MSFADRLPWLKHFGLNEAGSALDAVTGWMAKNRPGTASKADRQVQADNIQNLITKKNQVAASLTHRVSNPDDPEQAAKMGLLQHIEVINAKRTLATKALTALKTKRDGGATLSAGEMATATRAAKVIEGCNADLEIDQKSLEDTQLFVQEMQQAIDAATQELADYDSNLSAAQAEDRRADRELEMAKAKQERQKQLSGLTASTLKPSTTALDAIRAGAEKKRIAAKNLSETADTLRKATPVSDDDAFKSVLGTGAGQADPFAVLDSKAA
jgi:hypothetical protein